MNIEAYFKLTYGLYIIATKLNDKRNGYIANTAFQVTAEPSQIAISCSKDNYTCLMIRQSGIFSISILSQDASAEIIGLFGYNTGEKLDKFKSISFTESKTGSPIVTEDCIAWFDCKVNQQIDVGSHILFIASIEENELIDHISKPLTYAYYHEVKKGRAPKNAPTYIDESKFSTKEQSKATPSTKHKCLACGYVYDADEGDSESGISPDTSFEELPEDWICPTCGSSKDVFEAI